MHGHILSAKRSCLKGVWLRFLNEGAGESLSCTGACNREERVIGVISALKKSRSAIKWHRLAHFSQTRGCISWYHAVTQSMASPNPYFTKPGYLCRRVLCPLSRDFLFSRSHSTRSNWRLFVSVRLIPWQLCACRPYWHFLPLSALLPVLQLTLSQRLSLTHRGSCWPPGIKEAGWLSSRGSRR